jgi:hypothetical protein
LFKANSMHEAIDKYSEAIQKLIAINLASEKDSDDESDGEETVRAARGRTNSHARTHPPRHGNTIRHDVARHGTVRRGTARHAIALHATARHGTARHGTARHGTARHGTAQYDTT